LTSPTEEVRSLKKEGTKLCDCLVNHLDEKQYFIQRLSHSRRIISAREKWKLDSQLLTRQDTGNKGTDFPSHQYQHQLNEIFMTEDEADDFAAQKAMEWITKD